MKKVCAILMAVCLLLAGLCPALAEEKTYSIGTYQLAPHPALDAATKGCRDFLTEKRSDQVTFIENNAAGEAANCTLIMNNFLAENVDLIMANATGALQAAQSATGDIPILGRLFQSHNKNRADSEIVIAIKADILE